MKKIVIIEDDAEIRESYRYMLPADQYTIFQAETGQRGLKYVQSELPHLVILDLLIPGPSKKIYGLEILKKLKNNPKYRHIPILVVSNLPDYKSEALTLGADEYMEKANTSLDVFLRKIIRFTSASSR